MSKCGQACTGGGSSGETCGAGWLMQIYINPNPVVPTPTNFIPATKIMASVTATPWTSLGCFQDTSASASSPTNSSSVLNLTTGGFGIFENVMTVEMCTGK